MKLHGGSLEIARVHLKLHGFTLNCTGSLESTGSLEIVQDQLLNCTGDCLGLVKVIHDDLFVIPWMRVRENLHVQVQVELGFTLCDFPVAVQFFPKSHSSSM